MVVKTTGAYTVLAVSVVCTVHVDEFGGVGVRCLSLGSNARLDAARCRAFVTCVACPLYVRHFARQAVGGNMEFLPTQCEKNTGVCFS